MLSAADAFSCPALLVDTTAPALEEEAEADADEGGASLLSDEEGVDEGGASVPSVAAAGGAGASTSELPSYS